MNLLARSGLDRFNPAQGGVRQMRIVATGLLIAMAGVFIAAGEVMHLHPAWGSVRAFAEAAMVGGLADWFAVTALFRHPLGLPIPHTAIIPRNKDRIGDTLAAFLKDNFLTPEVVARRMRRMDVAAAGGRFLAAPGTGDGRLREGASKLAATVLEALDDERLGGMVKSAIATRLRALEVSPLLGQALAAAIAENRHVPVLDGLIGWANRALLHNEAMIHEMVSQRAGKLMRWTGLDEKLSTAIVEGLQKLIADMADDPAHPLRVRAEEGLANLARDLQDKPELRTKIEAMKAEIIANPAVVSWLDGLWQQGRTALLRAARDPQRVLAGRFGEALRQLGLTVQSDPRLRHMINRLARRATVGMVAAYGDGIVRLVSDTVRGWDANTVTGRLENAVGRDLQYIRINGTLVGGLVGLTLHAIEVAF